MITKKQYLSEILGKKLNSKGFKRRGTAYFRIIGDEILQVVKFEYERCFMDYSLDFGMFSMYDDLKPQWFTSAGCIPRYSVMLFENEKDPMIHKTVNGETIDIFVSPEEQLRILMYKGIRWLDNILTQEQLVEGLCILDTLSLGKVYWLDKEKIVPFLKSGRQEEAIRIISSILQINSGLRWWELPVWNEEEFLKYEKEHPNENQDLVKLYHLIVDKDNESLQRFFENNLKRNWNSAKFCKKP